MNLLLRVFGRDENYRKFRSLTKDQVKILYLRSKKGKIVRLVATEMHVSLAKLHEMQEPIFDLFGIRRVSGEGDRMWNELMVFVEGYLDKLDDKAVENWKPRRYTPRRPSRPPPSRSITWEDLETAPVAPETMPLSPPRDPGRAIMDLLRVHSRRLFWGIVLTVGILLLCRYTVMQIQPLSRGENPTPANSTMTFANSTPLILITKTPIRSVTTYLSPTTTYTRTPDPAILFYDNFDDGMKPDWKTERGEAFIQNGKLKCFKADQQDDILNVAGCTFSVGDLNWKNYKVEISWEAKDSCFEYANFSIGLRAQNINDSVQFSESGWGYYHWRILKDGKHIPVLYVPSTSDICSGVWTVYIQDNSFWYNNDSKSTVPNINPSGNVVLKISPSDDMHPDGMSIDYIKVTRLP